MAFKLDSVVPWGRNLENRSIEGTDEVWLHRLFVKYNH